jgi:cobyrinic acid a,c-diamide synthase
MAYRRGEGSNFDAVNSAKKVVNRPGFREGRCLQRQDPAMKTPPSNGLIVAGMQSSDGKTAVTCMLLSALIERGLPVQPFKVGPDFIDPGYHSRFADVPSRNLDLWLMGDAGVVHETKVHGAHKISIVEGVMGLFDGSDVHSHEGSTLAVARRLGWPVLLVVPCAKAGRSIAVSLNGFVAEAGVDMIAGVILNGVSGHSHASYLREAIAPLRVPVLGAIPICSELSWPERHLGLQAIEEHDLSARTALAALAEKYLDLPTILEMVVPAPSGPSEQDLPEKKFRLGLARDKAFHFYYEANLDYLRSLGAELVPFSPLLDSKLPNDLDGLLFGGGFPEVFADELSQNQAIRSEIYSALRDGLSCYAECGGLMYLAEELVTKSGKHFPMVGVIPGAVEMTEGLQDFGYCECSDLAGVEGETFRGHEFHYSRWTAESRLANLWTVRRKRIGSTRREGFRTNRLHASYVHLYFPASQAAVRPLMGKTEFTTL